MPKSFKKVQKDNTTVLRISQFRLILKIIFEPSNRYWHLLFWHSSSILKNERTRILTEAPTWNLKTRIKSQILVPSIFITTIDDTNCPKLFLFCIKKIDNLRANIYLSTYNSILVFKPSPIFSQQCKLAVRQFSEAGL